MQLPRKRVIKCHNWVGIYQDHVGLVLAQYNMFPMLEHDCVVIVSRTLISSILTSGVLVSLQAGVGVMWVRLHYGNAAPCSPVQTLLRGFPAAMRGSRRSHLQPGLRTVRVSKTFVI